MRRFASLAALAAAATTVLIALAGPAAAAAAPATGTKATTAAETTVLQLVNQQRAAKHCPALKANAALTKAARGRLHQRLGGREHRRRPDPRLNGLPVPRTGRPFSVPPGRLIDRGRRAWRHSGRLPGTGFRWPRPGHDLGWPS